MYSYISLLTLKTLLNYTQIIWRLLWLYYVNTFSYLWAFYSRVVYLNISEVLSSTQSVFYVFWSVHGLQLWFRSTIGALIGGFFLKYSAISEVFNVLEKVQTTRLIWNLMQLLSASKDIFRPLMAIIHFFMLSIINNRRNSGYERFVSTFICHYRLVTFERYIPQIRLQNSNLLL